MQNNKINDYIKYIISDKDLESLESKKIKEIVYLSNMLKIYPAKRIDMSLKRLSK